MRETIIFHDFIFVDCGRQKPYEQGNRCIDWKAVFQFIEENKNEIESVSAGLAEEWYSTSATIYTKEDSYVDSHGMEAHLSSDWATPSIHVVYTNKMTQSFEVWELGEESANPYNPPIYQLLY